MKFAKFSGIKTSGGFNPRPRPTSKKILIASFFGLLIGLAAGLLGVGGGEFRLPVLICLLGFPVAIAAAANLLIGLLTVTVGLAKRLALGVFEPVILSLVAVMSVGSVFGAYAGASLTGKVKEKYLKAAVGGLLLVLGLKMIHGAFIAPPSPDPPAAYSAMELISVGVLGAAIGVVCGALGVAGGELRIPLFIYLFGLPIKIAGTASLAISIPTVATGALKHGRMGHVSRGVVYTCIAMGIASVIGVFVGTALVIPAGEKFLHALLGFVLLLATVRVMRP